MDLDSGIIHIAEDKSIRTRSCSLFAQVSMRISLKDNAKASHSRQTSALFLYELALALDYLFADLQPILNNRCFHP